MTSAEPDQKNLPSFFRKPVLLCADEHRQYGVISGNNFSFAQEHNAVPLGFGEITSAFRDYPIVFSNGPLPVPIAVVGLLNGGNLFIDRDGNWRQNSFIPGYLRQHPFILSPRRAAKLQHLWWIATATALLMCGIIRERIVSLTMMETRQRRQKTFFPSALRLSRKLPRRKPLPQP